MSKSRDITLPMTSQSYGFSSSHLQIWELDHKEGQATKNWCFWVAVLMKTLESPLHCKEIKSVYPKGNQSWILTGRTDAETEAPVLWPPDGKRWLIEKRPQCWNRLKAKRKEGSITDSMDMNVKQTSGDSGGQRSLMCCSPWGCK